MWDFVGLARLWGNLQILGSRHVPQCVFAFRYVVLRDTYTALTIAAHEWRNPPRGFNIVRGFQILRHGAMRIFGCHLWLNGSVHCNCQWLR